MEPMKPLAPVKPMASMKPMSAADSSWWPSGLSQPSSSGAQDGMRYAFFPEQRRLAVEWDGKVELYDTGTHQISGVLQSSTQAAGHARFTDQTGEVDIASLKRVER